MVCICIDKDNTDCSHLLFARQFSLPLMLILARASLQSGHMMSGRRRLFLDPTDEEEDAMDGVGFELGMGVDVLDGVAAINRRTAIGNGIILPTID